MIHIESEFPFPQDLLERAARTTLEHESESIDRDLSIVLTDNARLHELNLNYLGVDAPAGAVAGCVVGAGVYITPHRLREAVDERDIVTSLRAFKAQ